MPFLRSLSRLGFGWRSRLASSRLRVLLAAALLSLLLAVIVELSLRLEYRAEADAIFDDAMRTAQKLAGRTAEVLDRVSQTTLLVKHLRETGSPLTLLSLREGGVLANDVSQAVLVGDARGFVIEATTDRLPLNIADEDHFKRLRKLAVGALDLGVVEPQPALDDFSLALSRRVSGPQGEFAGIVTALVPPAALIARSEERPGTALSVIGQDGVLRARLLDGKLSWGDRLDVSNIQARQSEVRRAGLPVKSRIDGVPRFVAVVEVERYPLLAVVAVDAETALASYRSSRNRLLAWALGIGLLLTLGTAALLAQARRLDQSRLRQQEAEAGLRATLEGSLDSVAIMRAVRAADGSVEDLLIIDANARATEYIGRGETNVVGRKLCELAPSLREQGYLAQFAKVIATRRPRSAEVQATDPHLAGRWLHHQVVAVGDGIALISRDITESRQAAQDLAEQRNFLQKLLDYLPLPVYAKSARPATLGRYLFWNQAAERVFHRPAETVVGRTVHELFPAEDAQRFEAQDAQILASGEVQRFPDQVFEGPAGRRYVDTVKVPVRGSDGLIDHLLVIAEDVTERRNHAQELADMARRDSLTALPNRRYFDERLAESLLRAARMDRLPALLFIDLDGFKAVNDELGHEAGDQLLIEVARRLKTCVRATDLVSRLGGDEFTVLLEDCEPLQAVERLCQRMVESLSVPHLLAGRSVRATPSIGLALAQAEEAADSLLRRADDAMYAAKRAGKGRYVLAA